MPSYFPTGLMIDPARSRIRQDMGYEPDRTSKSRTKLTRQRRSAIYLDVVFHGVTQAERAEVRNFLNANRAANDINIVYQDIVAEGSIIGDPIITRITRDQYEVSFTLQAKTAQSFGLEWVIASGVWNDNGIWLDTELCP